MDPITGLNQIMAMLRRQVSQQSQTSKRSETPAAHAQTAKPSAEEILRRINERIRQLDPDQRQGNKAAQILIQSILVWEFGESLLQDPKLEALSRRVSETMERDQQAWDSVQALLRNL